ncbi:MAG: hypothetical protein C0520_15300 [Sphingopyxis sp.]|nr:hypothetical protein [Sphingopyxis sp.]
MARKFRRPLSLALGALATTTFGGCYYGDLYGTDYASAGYACETRYGATYYDDYDPYAYDDGYGYDCYDGADYGGGFVQIGFGGGWYDDYYYPGYGTWMFDSYRNRYPLSGHYLNYWGGRRAWWKHRNDRPDGGWNGSGRPGRGDHDGRPGRPGGWHGGDLDDDGPRGTPGRGNGRPPVTGNPGSPVTTPAQPPRGPAAVRPRPRPETVAGDQVPDRPRVPGVVRPRPDRGDAPRGMGRPVRSPDGAAPVERPVRQPDSVRPSARPPQPVAQPAPVARPAPAPAARPAAPPRPSGDRPVRVERVREN